MSMSWQPKLRPKGFPHSMDDFAAMASLSELEHRARTDDKRDQRVFRVKRKHVLKACDRCRVKKTKCDGKQPCNRCSVYNHPCLFRERKATQTKVYSRGFVEMLESHHSLVVKALQKLYKFCITNEGFPGDPLAEAPDGHPLTHAILDRLGLIKQAEENADEPDEDSEDLRYLRLLSTSTECSVTAEPSPEPTTPPEPSPTISRPQNPPVSVPVPPTRSTANWQWDLQPQTTYSYSEAEYHNLLALQRGSMSAPDIPDIPPHVELPPSLQNEQSFAYGIGCCEQQDVKPVVSRLPPGLMDPGMAGMSAGMMGEFQFQGNDGFYPGFQPGWTFPSG